MLSITAPFQAVRGCSIYTHSTGDELIPSCKSIWLPTLGTAFCQARVAASPQWLTAASARTTSLAPVLVGSRWLGCPRPVAGTPPLASAGSPAGKRLQAAERPPSLLLQQDYTRAAPSCWSDACNGTAMQGPCQGQHGQCWAASIPQGGQTGELAAHFKCIQIVIAELRPDQEIIIASDAVFYMRELTTWSRLLRPSMSLSKIVVSGQSPVRSALFVVIGAGGPRASWRCR